MQTTVERPADSAGELYFKTDVSPEQIFQAIGRLRKEARDEIDRLIRFLDDSDDHMEREPDDDEPSLGTQEAFPGQGRGGGGDDREPDLGTFDRMINQEEASRQRLGEEQVEIDAELDQADHEPSLGSVERHGSGLGWGPGSNPTGDQTRWASGGTGDLEDECVTGIADHDGLLEQVGSEDWRRGGMA